MASIKFDVSGVEAGRSRIVPKPGLYPCKITQCMDVTPTNGKDRRLEVIYEITKGEFKGAKLYDYINLVSETQAWKLRQFLEAVGVVSEKKAKGTFDPNKVVGTGVTVRVTVENDEQFGPSARPRTVLPLEGEDLEDEDEDLSEDEEDEEETEDEEEEDEEEEEEDDEEEGVTLEELQEMDRKELKAFIKEAELEIKVTAKKTDEDLVAEIAESLEIETEKEDEEEEDEVDYDAMAVGELRKLLKARKLKSDGPKPVLVKRLQADDEPV